jgi:RNA polymerase sigma-70 factor (ECF subfamily)
MSTFFLTAVALTGKDHYNVDHVTQVERLVKDETRMSLSDKELVASLQRGEAAAVDELLAQYADRLYSYIYYHSGDHHLAEDLVSETFTRVIEKVGSYVQREVPFRAWLFQIAHNLLADHFRKYKRRNTVSLDALDWDNEKPPADWGAADGGSLAEQVADRLELQDAIKTLPEDQRTVFILRFVEGFELERVSEILGKSLMSVKSLQYRAVRNLRRILGEAGDRGVVTQDLAE